MKYAVVDTSTNRILWTGQCPDEASMALQAQQTVPGRLAVDISAIEPEVGHIDENLYFYDPAAGAVRAKEPMPASAPATAAVGAPVSVAAPAGAELFVDGVSHGAMASGAEVITFADAGTYEVRLQLWPWLDAVIAVLVP